MQVDIHCTTRHSKVALQEIILVDCITEKYIQRYPVASCCIEVGVKPSSVPDPEDELGFTA